MLKCPKCGAELKASFNKYQDKDGDYVEVEFSCDDDETHAYWTRIKEDDLLEG